MYKILIVEDQIHIRELIERTIQKKGYYSTNSYQQICFVLLRLSFININNPIIDT
jgi:DNA-binding NtrC family response regulator